MTLVQIGGKRGDGPSFEQPFEMMEACHERLHRMLALLERLRAHLPQHGADDQARQAARDIMKYFDQAAPNHHRDEELHVFPPLLASGDAALVEAARRLQAEHVRMEDHWAELREWLDAVGTGTLGGFTPQQGERIDAFAQLHAGHIDAEEGMAYPAARAGMDSNALQAMGREMAARRGGERKR